MQGKINLTKQNTIRNKYMAISNKLKNSISNILDTFLKNNRIPY